ncbi:DUF397 domain-containing protein [Actinomadura terrae]|uniref:DUF397 domain-containing protein n=1 Tax=Actinomadura terrae TaxID=604353 RepID=UPI001FA6D2F9|nr:DUF397 domain-containing protein [Actinomadura terrae]
MANLVWRKSSHSGTQEGNCVEVVELPQGVGIRDSKNPNQGHLTLAPQAFATLLTQAKRGDLTP